MLPAIQPAAVGVPISWFVLFVTFVKEFDIPKSWIIPPDAT